MDWNQMLPLLAGQEEISIAVHPQFAISHTIKPTLDNMQYHMPPFLLEDLPKVWHLARPDLESEALETYRRRVSGQKVDVEICIGKRPYLDARLHTFDFPDNDCEKAFPIAYLLGSYADRCVYETLLELDKHHIAEEIVLIPGLMIASDLGVNRLSSRLSAYTPVNARLAVLVDHADRYSKQYI